MKKKVRKGVCRFLCGCMILFMSPCSIQMISAETVEETEVAESEKAEVLEAEVLETEVLETEETKQLEEMPDELTSSVYGSAQTWYPETSGYFILIVRDNAGGRTARYRIDCNIGERHSNGINYRIYYKMYLIGGDELGITLEDREYYWSYVKI